MIMRVRGRSTRCIVDPEPHPSPPCLKGDCADSRRHRRGRSSVPVQSGGAVRSCQRLRAGRQLRLACGSPGAARRRMEMTDPPRRARMAAGADGRGPAGHGRHRVHAPDQAAAPDCGGGGAHGVRGANHHRGGHLRRRRRLPAEAHSGRGAADAAPGHRRGRRAHLCRRRAHGPRPGAHPRTRWQPAGDGGAAASS
jgi:hypothetical protein